MAKKKKPKENVYTPGGNPVCKECGNWYGLGIKHVCPDDIIT